MDIKCFFPLTESYMTGDDAIIATRSIQRGEAGGVVIDCPGGTMGDFMDDAIALSGQRFTAIAFDTGSLAVNYFLCADSRLALPNSSFTLHHVKAGLVGGTMRTLDELGWEYAISLAKMETRRPTRQEWLSHRELARSIRYAAEATHFQVRWISRRTGLEPGIVDQMLRDEVTLTAAEALNLGLVHRIIED